tara:strand:- start:59 stop:1018 length:960 start_codon:yes stop_codon:yes gene_type:complete
MTDKNSIEVNFTRKLNIDGSENPKYVDLLNEDKPISGQKFSCMSFISPEKILVQKNQFFFTEFLKHFDFSKSVERFTQFLNFISYKYSVDFTKLTADFQEYLNEEKELATIQYIRDEYKNFLDVNEERLEEEFGKSHSFQTNTRGVKNRGNYSTQEEAELRAKLLREVDPNHDVYVGPVGMWVPWEPEAYKTGRVEYLEEELNQLMSEKNKNESYAKKEFEKRIQEKKKEAIEENKKLAKKTGNKLTQNIDKDGNLIGVNNTIENNLIGKGDEVSSADIRKELFDGGLKRDEAFDYKKYYAEREKLEKANENGDTEKNN